MTPARSCFPVAYLFRADQICCLEVRNMDLSSELASKNTAHRARTENRAATPSARELRKEEKFQPGQVSRKA